MNGITVGYTPVSTTINISAWVQNFMCEDVDRRHDNVSTSGIRESVFEAVDVFVTFTIPALLVGADYEQWATFYRWAAAGGQFNFAPCYPTSSKIYPAVLEDTGFKPKRAGQQRYSLDVKLRLVPGSAAPADAGEVMHAFWGLS